MRDLLAATEQVVTDVFSVDIATFGFDSGSGGQYQARLGDGAVLDLLYFTKSTSFCEYCLLPKSKR